MNEDQNVSVGLLGTFANASVNSFGAKTSDIMNRLRITREARSIIWKLSIFSVVCF